MPGNVVAVHLCVEKRAPLRRVERAEARPDFGLAGDRHALAGSARQVLLIEEEILLDLGLEPGVVRENVTLRGVVVNGLLAGARVRLGRVVLEVTGACRPCSRMDEIRPGLQAQLEGRRGTLCRVLEGGVLRRGDPVAVEGAPPARS